MIGYLRDAVIVLSTLCAIAVWLDLPESKKSDNGPRESGPKPYQEEK
jgi:hypothetical protein